MQVRSRIGDEARLPAGRPGSLYEDLGSRLGTGEAADVGVTAVAHEPACVVADAAQVQRGLGRVGQALDQTNAAAREDRHDLINAGAVVSEVLVQAIEAAVVDIALDDGDRDRVRRLATDLPALWHAATTTMVDRKRLLRLVVTEVTLSTHPERREATFKVLWCGGAVTHHTADCPPIGGHQQTKADVLERLAELAHSRPDHQVAECLNAEGLRTRTGKPWTYARVHSMRKQHSIPTGCPLKPGLAAARADGLVSSKMAAERLRVSASLINLWVKHGVLSHDQRMPASKVWVRLNEEDVARLTGTTADAVSLPTFGSVKAQAGLTQHEIWQQVLAGRYLPYRVRRGQTWQWHLKKACPTDTPKPPPMVRRNRKGDTPYE